jgi:phosphoribosylformimino-5-aminoimidazole carboxamide ribotide isomerase
MDLMGGQVVRARRGERQAYQPIVSSLCDTSNPLEVAQALLELYPFETLYIADLDSIQKRGDHLETIIALRATLPDIGIWVDAGITSVEDCSRWLGLGLDCVIGSESLPDADVAGKLIGHVGMDRAVLSLDFVNGRFKGPAALLEDACLWPQQVIAMTLRRVGSYDGPDFELIESLLKRADGKRLYAAGGVRNISDLENLKAMGIPGTLREIGRAHV